MYFVYIYIIYLKSKMTSNVCSNCKKYEVATTHFCGYKDWCMVCDRSLWSTRYDNVNTTITTTTTNEDADEELDYCEECYKTVRDVFLVDIKQPNVILVENNRPKGAKWCTQECLDSYNVKHPQMAHCTECYLRIELEQAIEGGGLCKICHLLNTC